MGDNDPRRQYDAILARIDARRRGENLARETDEALLRRLEETTNHKRYCFLPATSPSTSDNIVKFHMTVTGWVIYVFRLSWPPAAALAAWFLLALNLYYRGLIYIVLGGKVSST